MKQLLTMAATVAATSVFSAVGTFAQVSDDGMGKIVPVELYVCSYNEGMGRGDLNAVVEQWSASMDEGDADAYAAWLLTPYYHGADQDFDVIWMGAYKDGIAMGEGEHAWITEGGEMAGAFAEVMDCGVHVGLSSAMYQSPPDNETPGSAILTMSDCKMNEGTRYSDVRAAEVKWAAHRTESGSKAGMYHWFPTYGGGDQEFDYKIVYAFPDFRELGKDWEMIANGGGREVSQGLFGDLDECNDERVYVATSIRSTQLRK